ncbi:MAG: NAD(P)H-hydrate dehydratase [Elusimicrobiota bacterium]|jgi:NAD(P)H-hydrate epimerase|nr:NAD(P)H-hydrate dehydratase [Elusimicrobiota bacterium]MDR0734654.1 NAD(P)H-hydrate dehydratase [Elusimicrobiota bacterium]
MQKINKAFVKKHFPARPADSYKNLNGRVLIVAGSADMPGAAVLCARACFAAGAGLVTLAAPHAVYNAAVNAVPQAIILKMPQSARAAMAKIIARNKSVPHDLMLIGPGLDESWAVMTSYLLDKTKLPAVIDASSLNALAAAGADKLAKDIPHILTPHKGEMRRLLGGPANAASAAELAQTTGAVCLLKGPGTIVSGAGITMRNTTGNSGLAKAGSGDILSGIIAGVWGQLIHVEDSRRLQQKAFDAAAAGVWLHGVAADAAVKKISKNSLAAEDILAALPSAMRQITG